MRTFARVSTHTSTTAAASHDHHDNLCSSTAAGGARIAQRDTTYSTRHTSFSVVHHRIVVRVSCLKLLTCTRVIRKRAGQSRSYRYHQYYYCVCERSWPSVRLPRSSLTSCTHTYFVIARAYSSKRFQKRIWTSRHRREWWQCERVKRNVYMHIYTNPPTDRFKNVMQQPVNRSDARVNSNVVHIILYRYFGPKSFDLHFTFIAGIYTPTYYYCQVHSSRAFLCFQIGAIY